MGFEGWERGGKGSMRVSSSRFEAQNLSADLKSQNSGLSHKFPEPWLVSTANASQGFTARESGLFFQIDISETCDKGRENDQDLGLGQVC